jgi:hypothetical protein
MKINKVWSSHKVIKNDFGIRLTDRRNESTTGGDYSGDVPPDVARNAFIGLRKHIYERVDTLLPFPLIPQSGRSACLPDIAKAGRYMRRQAFLRKTPPDDGMLSDTDE